MNKLSISRDGFRQLLSKKVPPEAVDYCFSLWSEHPFAFKLRRARMTKLGDYRYDPRDKSHTITVNSDLNPYQFLITYVHEVAHRVVHVPRSNQKPHGPQWKNKFRELMLPVLLPEIFPDELLRVLSSHMRNPKASTAGDPQLVKTLAQYDTHKEKLYTLSDVALGDDFIFRKRNFRKLEKKRTRALCLDLGNEKRYLIPEMAEVTPHGEPEEKLTCLLSDVGLKQRFVYKANVYEKLETKGNRSMCIRLHDRALYSIPETAEITLVDN